MAFNYAQFAAEFPWFFPCVAFVFGAVIGSFLNVCIYRIPAGKSVVTPGSHCACGAPVAWYDNIPIVSWLILRGRARCCGRRFSFRYAFVELLTALLFLRCWMIFPPVKALCAMLFVAVLVVAVFVDLDHLIIPECCTVGAAVVGVALSLLAPSLHGQHSDIFLIASFRSGAISLLGLLVGSALVLWIALLAEAVLKKEAMGFGDVKFLGAIGAFCGWQGAVFSIFGGAVIGTVWALLAATWNKLAARPPAPATADDVKPPPAPTDALLAPTLGAQVPFGPMLAAGAALYLLWLQPAVDAYFAALAPLFSA